MPTFSFSAVPKVKVTKAPKMIRAIPTKMVSKDVEGYVYIDMQANYTVHCLDMGVHYTYPIMDKCFSCKGHEYVYRVAHPTMIKLVRGRTIDDRQELNTKYWLPFAPGSVVHGDIIHVNGINMFDIKEVDVFNNGSQASDEAFKFYKDNKQQIDIILKERQNG